MSDFDRLAEYATRVGVENGVLKRQLVSARTEIDQLREQLREVEARMYLSQAECEGLKEQLFCDLKPTQ